MADKTQRDDPTAEARDAIAFLVYFAAALIAGGVAYNHAYDTAFQYPVRDTEALLSCAVDFSVAVLWEHSYWVFAALIVVAFIRLFFLARTRWSPWLGYSSLSALLIISLMASILVGDDIGSRDAVRDLAEDTTTLPQVKLYVDGSHVNDNDGADSTFASGDYRLLSKTSDEMLVFVPSETSGSFVTVEAIKVVDIVRYQVIFDNGD